MTTNLSLSELPDPVIELVVSMLRTQDLVSLSKSNRQFHEVCNRRLYMNILITRDYLRDVSYESFQVRPYTILRYNNLLKFTTTLQLHRYLIPFIQRVTILTYSTLSNPYSRWSNVYDVLYGILLSKYSHLKFFENLDYVNVKCSENLLQYNHQLTLQESLRSEVLFENDHQGLEPGDFTRKIKRLSNYQIGYLKDFELIPLEDEDEKDQANNELSKLSVSIEQVYNQPLNFQNFHFKDQLLKKFEHLQHLELNSSISSEIVLSKLFNLTNKHVRFTDLETLSLTYTHSTRSPFELMLDCKRFALLFNLNNLKNLELKLNCEDINCQYCIEMFLNDLLPQLSDNLRRLSLVYVTNENLLANSRIDFEPHHLGFVGTDTSDYKNLWSRPLQILKCLNKLEYLYVNLNDFSFIPFLIKDPSNSPNVNSNSIHIYNFDITQEYILMKNRDYENLTSLSLKNLIITDFFYNWKIFLQLDGTDEEFEDGLHFLSYLNKCECKLCHHSRMLFHIYSESPRFPELSAIKVNDSANDNNFYFKFPVQDKSLATRELTNYRFFYNSFIRTLKHALPHTDMIFSSQSGLTVLDFPFNDLYRVDSDHFNKFIILVVHNIFDVLKDLLLKNPMLENLVLGGIFFHFQKLEDSLYKCIGPYDNFKYILDVRENEFRGIGQSI